MSSLLAQIRKLVVQINFLTAMSRSLARMLALAKMSSLLAQIPRRSSRDGRRVRHE